MKKCNRELVGLSWIPLVLAVLMIASCPTVDTTPPSIPTDLVVTAVSSSEIDLSWSPSTDNVGVAGYKIYRGGKYLKSVTTGTSTTDTGLSANTQYGYAVSAYDTASNESAQSAAQYVTTPSSGFLAPTGLLVTATTSTTASLKWTDNSGDEDGFKIERKTPESVFSQISVVGANVTSYTDSNLVPASTYLYRVLAYVGGADSDYSNIVQATTQGTANYTLTVKGAGAGYGDVSSSPAGISYPTVSSASFSSGTTVTLTATTDASSTFLSWSGQDSASGPSCTVVMTSDRTVTATFALKASGSFTLTLPSTSSTGTYTLSWTYSGMLVPSNWAIQEDSDSSFATPTAYTSYDTDSPYEYTFTNKPDGVYYYRVASPSGAWSSWVSIVVAHPTTAVLRVANSTHYDMIDIRLNGQQQAAYPYALLAGQSCNFTFANSGTVTYNLGVGFYNTDGSRDVWFTLSGSTAVSAGQTTTVTFSNPTIGQLLSGFNSSGRNWDGYYFDANAGYHAARFWFGYSGSWKFYVDGSQSGSGAVTLVSWVDYATIITFKVSGSGDTIQLLYPFGSFMYRNGPASWPIIQYVAQ